MKFSIATRLWIPVAVMSVMTVVMTLGAASGHAPCWKSPR